MLAQVVLALELGVLLALLTACSTIPDVVRELGQDPATLCLTYMGPQGNIALSRVNRDGQSLTCRGEGHQIGPITPLEKGK